MTCRFTRESSPVIRVEMSGPTKQCSPARPIYTGTSLSMVLFNENGNLTLVEIPVGGKFAQSQVLAMFCKAGWHSGWFGRWLDGNDFNVSQG